LPLFDMTGQVGVKSFGPKPQSLEEALVRRRPLIAEMLAHRRVLFVARAACCGRLPSFWFGMTGGRARATRRVVLVR
jgi:hypothetical protein